MLKRHYGNGAKAEVIMVLAPGVSLSDRHELDLYKSLLLLLLLLIITDIYNAPCLSHSDTPSADGPSSSFHLKDM